MTSEVVLSIILILLCVGALSLASIVARATEESHDVAVMNVVSSKTVVGEGYSLFINVSVQNQGDATETFNVTALADLNGAIIGDEITIGTQNVTLASGNSTTFTFTMTPIGITYGNYILSARANTVPDETDTTDNSYIDSEVYVGIPGDFDTDGDVDPDDFAIFMATCAARKGDPYYDPNIDFDNDGYQDPDDFAIFAANYGETT